MNESLLSTAGSSPFVPVAAMEEGFGPGFIQSPQAAKGTHCRHKPGRTKSDKVGCPLFHGTCRVSKPCSGTLFLPEDLQVAKRWDRGQPHPF